MKKFLLLFILVLTPGLCFSQSVKNNFKFVFLPEGLNFLPLKAGIDEPRMGLLYYSQNSNLKVDIGNSVDLFGFNFQSSRTRITVGADFFAYAYVTSFLQYRLQIDAIDGFFGGNVAYSRAFDDNRLVARFRYLHSSSHLVDGHWNALEMQWIDNKLPSPYGNNYAELLLAQEIYPGHNYLRYYAGLSHSTGMKTAGKKLRKNIFKLGTEYAYSDLFGKVLGRDENIFYAMNFDIKGIPSYIVNQNYLLGMKFGKWTGKGIVIYLSYYNGGDVFNQYFNERVSRFGLGFMFDFI